MRFGATPYQFFPFITVAPGGRVDVCFQDRSYAPGQRASLHDVRPSSDGAPRFTRRQVAKNGFDSSNKQLHRRLQLAGIDLGRCAADLRRGRLRGADSTGQEVFIAIVSP
jgi:hypothetical protein